MKRDLKLKMPKIDISKFNPKLILRYGIVLLFSISLFLIKPAINPPQTEAAPQETNVDVFTGQIIPAFIASEYDPTEAFKMLAGGTVYVFAYDTWGSGSMVVGGIAVKTQIRADGTFQAVGLPHASKYGVYFPYDDNGPTEGNRFVKLDPNIGCDVANCVCTPTFDCVGDGNSAEMVCAPYMCGSDNMQTVPFRWPKYDALHPDDPNLSDNILDVFSYQQKDYPAEVGAIIHDQLGNVVNLNNVIQGVAQGGKRVFITSSNKLDIENHLNVFPVIPTSVLKFKVNNHTTVNAGNPLNQEIFSSPISIIATRIMIDNWGSAPQSYPVESEAMKYLYVRDPVITGKTTSDGDFEVFAPPGIYTLTYFYNNDFFGFITRHVRPTSVSGGGALINEWSSWSNPIIGQDINDSYYTANLYDNECSLQTGTTHYLYLYLYYRPVYIWGLLTRSLSTTNARGETMTVSPLP
ncbi:hypothetical protein COY34_01490, partial [candidate division WWE3 bacterium CG_4_10_14_0_2_um_filter_42_8]